MRGCVTSVTRVRVGNGDTHQHGGLVEVMAETVGWVLKYRGAGGGSSALSKHLIGPPQLRVDLIGCVDRV